MNIPIKKVRFKSFDIKRHVLRRQNAMISCHLTVCEMFSFIEKFETSSCSELSFFELKDIFISVYIIYDLYHTSNTDMLYKLKHLFNIHSHFNTTKMKQALCKRINFIEYLYS
jgi:hypothetical protein